MPEVLLSNDDITVLGPPSTVELLVDVGPQGIRGSKVFVGSGDPNPQTSSGFIFGQSLILNDLYINTSPSGEYGYMYQYLSQPGGDVWVKILDLKPVAYSLNYQAEFTAGSAQVVIPISDIVTVTGTPLIAENFNVQYSIAHTNPVASSIAIPGLVTSDLVVNFTAVESDSGTWQDLDGEITIHLLITVVP